MDNRVKVIVAIVLAFSCVPPANGCGFHAPLGAQLESMYPGSFPVAVALRKAADSGVINAAALEAPRTPTALFIETMPRLQRLRKALAASPVAAKLPVTFSLGYVESRLWTRYSQSDGNIRIDIHIDSPIEGEAVVLTGEPVLMELFTGRLTVEQALADGMILINGNESEKSAIRDALIAASDYSRATAHSVTTTSASTTPLH
ncbi:MAG: hypothetical protein AB7K04_01965 [Pseudorhodoplanes sp.]